MAKQCTACPNFNNSVQAHHVIPLSYGGRKSGPNVRMADLCSNCHIEVHQCIENADAFVRPAIQNIVWWGRLAKVKAARGELLALDRRPTLLIPLDPNDEKVLAALGQAFNIKGRANIMLAAMRFAAANVRRVKPNG